MTGLEWDEQDFLECLGTPSTEECGYSHTYVVNRCALTLMLTVWPDENAVQIRLAREGAEHPLTAFALMVRGSVRRRREKWGEWLEFTDCLVVPEQFYTVELDDPLDHRRHPDGIRIEITVTPDLRITFA